jgi:hypothetical protein
LANGSTRPCFAAIDAVCCRANKTRAQFGVFDFGCRRQDVCWWFNNLAAGV